MDAVDLEQVRGQTGSAVLDLADGKVVKSSGDLDVAHEGTANTLMRLYRIMEDATKCVEDEVEGLKRITVSFADSNYVLTASDKHVYIVRVNSG